MLDRFHRPLSSGEGRGEPVGLGLPVAKQLVEAHGGTVALRSEPAEGTTVTIRLPRGS